ncbi:MAG: Stk1 family PASTA domain-containing Ser/Thr kinase [Lachnospiraceae bacterium]|nr:Stk1 family PASTA domain-containing Ser/Thr kinase [Lachnospiraceae bacterium]
MLRIGMFLGNRYEILEKIGSGGMSDVYKAKCHKLNRYVAIKVLKQEFNSDRSFVQKFRAEAQAAAGLTHPNIVNVYDVGDEADMHYIVMELVEGITLKTYIEKKGKLESRETIGITIQMAQGIEAAHGQHIVHRDIKPQNIIISKDGKVKVTDFGIAKAASTQTISSNAMGSVHYISPEQARGGYCDERSDIYSLGISMYEMVTGRVPYEGDSTVSIALLHIQGEMVPASELVPEIPVSLDKIIMKCTQKKPEMRYATITALIADLKRALVTPNEDFVKIVPLMAAASAATRVITEEDVSKIKKETSKINVGQLDEERAYLMGEEDDYDEWENEGYLEGDDDYDDEDEDASPMFEKIMMGIGIGVAILIVILAIFILGNIFGLFGGGETQPPKETTTQSGTEQADEVEMPDLVGKPWEEAEDLLEKAGLYSKIERAENENYEENVVIEQEVSAGTMVKKGRRVIITINSFTTEREIPESLVGLPLNTVKYQLNKLGLEIEVVEQFSEEVGEGKVISLEPGEGTTVQVTDIIKVYVSKGSEVKKATVPSVAGLKIEDAKKRLEEAGFVCQVNEEESDTVGEGYVIRQSESMVSLPVGTTITVHVSVGSSMTKVPQLVGDAEANALAKLEAVGLRGAVEYREDADNVGVVISQSVTAETKIEKDTVITIVVGKAPETQAPTDAPTEAPTDAPVEPEPPVVEPEPPVEPEQPAETPVSDAGAAANVDAE